MKEPTILRNKRNVNQGITLIALVITIIVLLILAGISIAMLTGENGILRKAEVAKEQTDEEKAKEKLIIAINGLQISKNGEAKLLDINEFDDLNSSNYNQEISLEKPVISSEKIATVIVDNQYTFIIDENLRIEIKKNNDNNNHADEEYVYGKFVMPRLTNNECTINKDNYKVTASTSRSSQPPYGAFDGVIENNRDNGCWHSAKGTSQWIQIQFPYKIKISQFMIKNRQSNATYENIAVKDFTLEGSNDGENWSELGQYTNNYGSLVETSFNVKDPSLYIYYRWNSTSSYGAYIAIGEIILEDAECLIKSPAIICSEINNIKENSENLYSQLTLILEDYNRLKDKDKTQVYNYSKLVEMINRYNNSIETVKYQMPNLNSNDCEVEGERYKVTASSSQSNQQPPYGAFDGVIENNRDNGCWHSAKGTSQWIQIQFPYKIKISQFMIKNRQSNATYENIAVKDFTLEGSKDGENWIKLGEYNNQYGSLVETVFNVENPDLYNYYRWSSTSSYGAYIAIGEIMLKEASKCNKPYINIEE